MDRRDFIRKSVFASALAGSAIALGDYKDLFAMSSRLPLAGYDLVAVKGGEPDKMFDKAIASLGGMNKFVKKGQTVVLKPNIGWDVPPERGGNTNPLLVKRIIEHCFNAGAKDVYVFDHTCHYWIKTYSTSGIEKAVKDAGGKIVSGANERYYQEVNIPNGKKLTKDKVHELILQSNVWINVPILKHHSGAGITVSMKNMMGAIWDRNYWHQNDLQQCIADFSTWRKPDLNVVDAYYVMKKNGPQGVSIDDVVIMKSQIVSTDIVAADAAAAKLFGLEPKDIGHIKYAADMKIGRMDLDKLSINRIKI